jgi:hypothetical protein
MKHEGLAHLPDQTQSVVTSQNGHTPFQPLEFPPSQSRQRLPQLRALFSAARSLLTRRREPESPTQPDQLDGYHHEISPLGLPIFEPEQPQEPIADQPRTKPANPPPQPQIYTDPSPEHELLQLQGSPWAVQPATLIRERFWTQVVRGLAKESAHGTPSHQIELARRSYMRRANTKLDAVWWIQNQDKLL